MINAAIVERLRSEAEEPSGFRSPLARIEALAYEIAQTAPGALMQTSEILALVRAVKESEPARDEVVEAIETVCGDDLSGCSVSRVADAVMRLRRR